MYILEASFPLKENIGRYFRQFIDSTLMKFKKEVGSKPELYYFTFKDDGYEDERVTMVCLSSDTFVPDHITRHKIIVTAPADQIDKAIEIVQDMNYHISLQKDFVGYNADDFIHNRQTARLHVC